MPRKLMRCLRKVKAQKPKTGKPKSPMAVCIKSTGQKPHRRKKK